MMTGNVKANLHAAVKLALRRAKGAQGETLVETLVSLLIGGLALLMLAVVIASATRMVSSSGESMEDYYEGANAIALASSSGGVATAAGTVQVTDRNGNPIAFEAGQSAQKSVTFIIGDASGRKVVSYSTNDDGAGGAGGD